MVDLGLKLTPVLLTGGLFQGLGTPGMEAAMTARSEPQVWGSNWPYQGVPAKPSRPLSSLREDHQARWAGHLLGIITGDR